MPAARRHRHASQFSTLQFTCTSHKHLALYLAVYHLAFSHFRSLHTPSGELSGELNISRKHDVHMGLKDVQKLKVIYRLLCILPLRILYVCYALHPKFRYAVYTVRITRLRILYHTDQKVSRRFLNTFNCLFIYY